MSRYLKKFNSLSDLENFYKITNYEEPLVSLTTITGGKRLDYNGKPNYVDFGLASGNKGATCNVGAHFPEEYGDAFAGGETSSKTNYAGSTYTYGTEDNLTKYNSTDNKAVLEATDDAATVNWGNNGKTPTEDDGDELLTYTTGTWTTVNGVNGYRITSNNTNIFLPAAGGLSGTDVSIHTTGAYGSSSLYDTVKTDAKCLNFTSNQILMDEHLRYYGNVIRPILKTS